MLTLRTQDSLTGGTQEFQTERKNEKAQRQKQKTMKERKKRSKLLYGKGSPRKRREVRELGINRKRKAKATVPWAGCTHGPDR